jgi:hypothetical protein
MKSWLFQTLKGVSDQPRSAQIQAYCACHRLHGPRELTEILSPTHNATAQPGKSQPRYCEAFLPLARSNRIKGMLRASLHYYSHRGSIAVRIVIVRRRKEGAELSLCLYLGQRDARGVIAITTVRSIESKVADQGFWL